MSRNHRNKSTRKNASTQTSDTDISVEIARLQEEVNILKLENSVLRKHMIENTASELRVALPETILHNRKLSTKYHLVDAQSKKLDDDQSLQKSAIKTGIRGCSCKGTCATKICGCMKKEFKCGELCRCNNNLCQNQIQKDTQTNVQDSNYEYSELPSIKISEIISNRFETKHTSKRLFSPDVVLDNLQYNLDELSIEPLQFESAKKLAFESDDETENENVNGRMIKTIEKQSQRAKGKLEKDTLKLTTTVHKKGKAISNEELRSEPQDSGGQGATRLTRKTVTLRRHKSAEIAHKNETTELTQKNANYHKNIKRGMMPLRRGREQKLVNREKKDSHLEGDTSGPIDAQRSNSCETNSPTKLNDTTFDPMKPTHQLMRTPTFGDTSNFQNVSAISLPIVVSHPIVNEEKEDDTILAELLEPEVDWEEYQSRLVACSKCHRKFHPLRIKKHISCCKNL